jgi:hypothetical protein
MAKWSPPSADVGLEFDQFASVLEMRDASLPSAALCVLHAHVEKFGRKLVNEIVTRNIDNGGPATISAANVRSVLRPYSAIMDAEFLTPRGLVRTAQTTERPTKQKDGTTEMKTILPISEADKEAMAEERKFVKSNHVKLMRNANLAIEERKKKRQKKQKGGGEEEASATAVV